MKNYLVYNQEGKILRTGSCPDDMIEIQAQKDEFVMEGVANDIEDKIIDHQVIRRTEEEINMIKERMKPDPKELLIQQMMQELLRGQAISELRKKGKL